MSEQTAVEWLEEELADTLKVIILNNDYRLMEKLFAQAKAMEKQQIMEAFSGGQETPLNHPTLPHYSRNEYYNETYGTKNI